MANYLHQHLVILDVGRLRQRIFGKGIPRFL